MSIASARPFLLPGLEAALREGVARRPWMADGSGTDGTGLTPVLYLSNQQSGSQSVPIVGLKELRRSIEESETPQAASTRPARASHLACLSASTALCSSAPAVRSSTSAEPDHDPPRQHN